MSELPPAPESERLRELIREAKLTQTAAADRLGVSHRMMSYWCTGAHLPPRTVMLAMEHIAHCWPEEPGSR